MPLIKTIYDELRNDYVILYIYVYAAQVEMTVLLF